MRDATVSAPVDAPTAAAEDLVGLMRRLRARMRQVPMGDLTPSQTAVLVRLAADQASSTTLLAAAEGVRPQSMTATVNALAERGLVERRPDPHDGRRQVLTLSVAGAKWVADNRAARHGWLADVLAERLDAEQLREVRDALRLLRAAVD